MPRYISFSMTTRQVLARTKDVTRRFGWWNLQPGTHLYGARKCMGLRKGEKVERLCTIEVVSVRTEPLNAITPDDVRREGFPDWSPDQFVQMLVDHYQVSPRQALQPYRVSIHRLRTPCSSHLPSP